MKAKRSDQPSSFVGSVVDRFQGELLRFLIRRLRNSDDAMDLAQEVYLRLLRVEDNADIKEPLAYVYRTASNALTEFRMRRSRESECVEFDSSATERGAENPLHLPSDEIIEQLSAEDLLDRTLESLPTLYRNILELRLRDGLGYDEIGRKLDLSGHTVKKYFFRSLTQVRMTRAE